MRLSKQAWWTEADAAELELVVHAFVDALFRHRPGCETCAAGGPWCAAVREVFADVIAWRDGRARASRAVALRLAQDLDDFRRLAEKVLRS